MQKKLVVQGFDLLGDELKKNEESYLKTTMEFVEKGFKEVVQAKDKDVVSYASSTSLEEEEEDDDEKEMGPKKKNAQDSSN